MIITLNTRSEFIPGKLIVDKKKGVITNDIVRIATDVLTHKTGSDE